MTDFTVLSLAGGVTLGLMAPTALDNEPFANLYGLLCLFHWIFIEPLHLTSSGTTPGKWLFRTRVVRVDGGRISYGAALVVYGLTLDERDGARARGTGHRVRLRWP